jgi:histidinol-phosphatase (PHP family)
MSWTNFHTHSHFCDGHAELEEYVRSALDENMHALGFSGHAPLHFETEWTMTPRQLAEYMAIIDELKRAYQDKIPLYKGLEVDYIQGLTGPNQYHGQGFDYLIGSVHVIGQFEDGTYWSFDHTPEHFTEGYEKIFLNDPKALASTYYQAIMEMVQKEPPDIIGHLDLIKKFNDQLGYLDESARWYRDLQQETLEIISQSGCILEINTRGWYKGLSNAPYPGRETLKACRERGIPVTINADAHAPGEVARLFEEAAEAAMSVGYNEVYALVKGKWKACKLTPKGIEYIP